MKKEELYRFVDHTALKAVTTWNEIQQLCQEARFSEWLLCVFQAAM